MSDPAGVTRVAHSDSAGTGLEEWEAMNPDSLVSGTPVQRGRLCGEDEGIGYLAGVWDCTAFVDTPGTYGVDEFMLLLEGTVIVAMPDGSETAISAGEAFVIPRNLRCQWKMPGYVRKVFMIVDDPAPEDATAPWLDRVTVPDLERPMPGGPIETVQTVFVNATGRMRVSLSESAGTPTAPAPDPAHTLVHVLTGSLVLRGEGGEARFGPGETAYVAAGSVVGRETGPGTRLLEATYIPRTG